jgi:hypothetical protein
VTPEPEERKSGYIEMDIYTLLTLQFANNFPTTPTLLLESKAKIVGYCVFGDVVVVVAFF